MEKTASALKQIQDQILESFKAEKVTIIDQNGEVYTAMMSFSNEKIIIDPSTVKKVEVREV